MSKKSRAPKNLFIDLPRPEYVGAPEVFVSELLWGISSTGRPPRKIGEQTHTGIVYSNVRATVKEGSSIIATRPSEDDPRHSQLRAVFSSHFLLDEGQSLAAAKVFLADIAGNTASKSKSRPIVPINDKLALMQDARGVTAKKGPPNYLDIFESIYSIGGGGQSVAQQLLAAFKSFDDAEKSSWLDDAANAILPPEIADIRQEILSCGPIQADFYQESTWLPDGNPFQWFNKSWTTLMNPQWVSSIPRRRWVDWMSCVLRTGLGTCYLFEMHFYYQLILQTAASDVEPLEISPTIMRKWKESLTWNQKDSVSNRDIASKVKSICARGMACRLLLVEWSLEENSCPSPLDYVGDTEGIKSWATATRAWLSQRPNYEQEIGLAISASLSRSANNTYELVIYTLLDRGQSSDYEDLYALFRKRGSRYTMVEPGREWFPVMASLCSGGPGRSCRVADLILALESIGVDSDYGTIIAELERGGLARSSNDADDAIIVASAF